MVKSDKNSIISSTYIRNSSLAALAPAIRQARVLVDEAQSANTRRAYRASWFAFSAWCRLKGLDSDVATPEIVALYLSSRLAEGFSTRDQEYGALIPSSLVREYSAIAHRLHAIAPQFWSDHRRPAAVAAVIRGAQRTQGRPPVRKAPVLAEHIGRIEWGEGLCAVRDRALCMLGFMGAFRRSELVALNREDLTLDEERGLTVLVRRSKTDQVGAGQVKAIPWDRDEPTACPIQALGAWIRAARIRTGPLFLGIRNGEVTDKRLGPSTVAVIVKRAVASLGLNAKKYSGHSLRAGFVTSSALQGLDLDSIMIQTGHKSTDQVRGYIRRADPFQNNAAMGLRLRKPKR
jgi:integrase